jgi:D-alanine-D-alanine ligase
MDIAYTNHMKTVAVIFGSRSTEHDVSVVTALASIIKPLDLSKNYNVVPIYIAKNGAWYSDDKLKDISLFSSGKITDWLAQAKPVSVQFDSGMTLVKASGIGRAKTQKIDIVFPATHGTYGEDGSLMGLLRMANVPFVGCDMDASVLAMDKVLAKLMAGSRQLPTSSMCYTDKLHFESDPKAFADLVEKTLNYPLFVKPAHLGSSIGISRAANRKELDNALEVAFHYDDKVLVEEEVSNLIEVTLPIMGNEQLQPALLERPLTQPENFHDFETKYMRGGKKGGSKTGGAKGAQGYSELPAKIDSKLYEKAVNLGIDVYRALGCSGIARVDMLINSKTGKVYFNEVNPLPGSIYAHNWRAAGVSGVELVQTLVRLAEERWQKQQTNDTVFTTNFLKQF